MSDETDPHLTPTAPQPVPPPDQAAPSSNPTAPTFGTPPPTASPSTSNESLEAQRRSRLPLVLVGLVLLATLGGLGFLAKTNADSANEWKATAHDETARADAAEDDLAAAEDDISDLEDQVADLASLKAQVEDESAHFQSQAEALSDLSSVADNAIEQMFVCLSANGDLSIAALDAGANPLSSYASQTFYDALNYAETVCQVAADNANDFQELWSLIDLTGL